MRGTAAIVALYAKDFGITPAHAGNSFSAAASAFVAEDHPRTCGEQNPGRIPSNHKRGSPPHMRGTVPDVPFDHIKHGITPAHAGNSPLMASMVPSVRDHPRTCGEQQYQLQYQYQYQGSPPHMRGTALHAEFQPGRDRITPAHAGNSHSGSGLEQLM